MGAHKSDLLGQFVWLRGLQNQLSRFIFTGIPHTIQKLHLRRQTNSDKKKILNIAVPFYFLFVFAVTVNIIWLHVCKLCKINRLFSQGVKKQHFLKCYIISVDCASLNDSLVSFFLKSIFVKWWLLNNTAVRAIRAHKLSFIINDFSNNQLSICTFQKISRDESWIRM